MRGKEFSPIGDDVGVDNPYLDGGSGSGGYPAYGDPSTFRCAWDSVEINCSSLNKFYISKNSQWILTLTIRERVGALVNQTKGELVPGGDRPGKVKFGEVGPGNHEPSHVEVIAEPDLFNLTSVGTIMSWVEMRPLEFTYLSPQRIEWTAVDPSAIRAALERMLSDEKCGKFVEDLINQLATDTGNPFVSDYALGLFDMVESQGSFVRGGLAYKNRVHATVSGQLIYGKGEKPGDAAIHITGKFNGPMAASTVSFIDAFNVLHELIHHAGLRRYYDDPQIAQTMYKMTGTPGRPRRGDYAKESEFISASSSYVSEVLRSKCPVLSR
jgi:hypothetical protein